MYYLDERVILKNQQSLFEACDFLIHDGTDGVSQELRANPRLLDAFMDEIHAVHDGAVIFVKIVDDARLFPAGLSAIKYALCSGDSWRGLLDTRAVLSSPRRSAHRM